MTQKPTDKNRLTQEKRDLARRARRLAQTQMLDSDRERLMQFAADLERESDDLQPVISLPPIAAPQAIQQQVQQQQSIDSSTQANEPMEKD
jgi:hypothetical protein